LKKKYKIYYDSGSTLFQCFGERTEFSPSVKRSRVECPSPIKHLALTFNSEQFHENLNRGKRLVKTTMLPQGKTTGGIV